jgi:hypothetical protein
MSSADKENIPTSTGNPNAEPPAQALGGKRNKSIKAVWRSQDSTLLIDTLLKEREAGHQSDTGFKPVAWTACALALQGSDVVSGGIVKTASSAHDHFGKVSPSAQPYSILEPWPSSRKISTLLKRSKSSPGLIGMLH